MKLSESQYKILKALANGNHLKSHRYLDGTKVNRIHAPNGDEVSVVNAKNVQRLVDLGFITSNMKFPAATYTLTALGAEIAALPHK